MAGARVTATVRDPDAREAITALGANAIEPEGFTDHGPFDVILELVGGAEPRRTNLRGARRPRPDLHHRRRRRARRPS